MPTGYTAKVQDGTCEKLQDFIWSCACAFIPYYDSPDYIKYYQDELDKAKFRLKELLDMTRKQAIKFSEKRKQEIIRQSTKTIAEKNKQYERYCSMLNQIKFWEPPTPEHVELKEFMIKQLTDSIKYDCNCEYEVQHIDKARHADKLYYWDRAVDDTTRDIEYYKRRLHAKQKNVSYFNKWKNDLANSVGPPPNKN